MYLVLHRLYELIIKLRRINVRKGILFTAHTEDDDMNVTYSIKPSDESITDWAAIYLHEEGDPAKAEDEVNINPLDIIIESRRYTALEESSSPQEWNSMFQNIETNFSPWKFPVNDRSNWTKEEQ